MESEQTQVGFEQIVRILRRRAVWIVLSFVVVTGAAFAYTKHQPKKYTATAAVSFSNDPLSEQVAGLTPITSNPVTQQNRNLELVRLGGAAAKTASLLGHGLTGAKVSTSLSTGLSGESGIVSISATSTSPTLAAEIANTYSAQFAKQQRRVNRRFYLSALAQVNRQLARLAREQRVGTDGAGLEDRAHTLEILLGLGYNNAQVAAEAVVPSSPSSPKTKRNTLLGALLGLALGLALAFLVERLDRRVREPEELEAIYGLSMLGSVPKSRALARTKSDGVQLPAAETEAFNLIRAHLRFFNADRDVRTVVMASPSLNDGKTTIAHRLAESAARTGTRALLVEADLRKPTLVARLGIPSGPGLTDTLIGAATLAESIQGVNLPGGFGPRSDRHTLHVLTAGTMLPPNPSELLESRAMHTLLTQLRETYDLVVIDTPPLTMVSDAFPLLTKVDGVIIVGRIGYSQRDTADALQKILAGSGASLLGVVANGSKTTNLKAYARTVSNKPTPTDSAPISDATEKLVSTPHT